MMNNYIKIIIILIIALLVLSFSRYLVNKNVIWKTKLKGELFTAQFYNNSKIILTGTFGLKCLDIDEGNIKWTDKIDGLVFSLNKPSLYKGKLFTGTDKSNKLYNIDISTGEYLNKYDVNGIVLLTNVSKNQLYYICRENGYSIYKIKMLNLNTKFVKTIYEFKDDIKHIRDPLIIYKDYIIVSILQRDEINFLYCINKNNGNLKWKIELPRTGIRFKNFVQYKDSVFWVDKDKSIVFEKNIETEFIKMFQIENISSPYMDYDGEHILIHGKVNEKGSQYAHYTQLYLYNVNDRNIVSIEENYNDAIISNGKIIYEYNNKIFLYYMENGDKRVIYSFKEELVDMYASEKNLLLVLAKDIRDVHHGYGSCKYVLLSVLK